MEPPKQEVEAELNQILSSPQIGNSTVLSDFLKFVVQETLDGRSEELKEYTIGINVLKRDSDFNPQIDSIVRIHAGRLRRALKEYYYEDGRKDKLLISIPKGGYIPSFQMKPEDLGENNTEHDDLTHITSKKSVRLHDEKLTFVTYEKFVNPKISLAVLPFKYIGQEDEGESFTRSMGEYLCTELTLFNYLNVISYYSGNATVSKTKDIREVSNLLGAEYILTGSVHTHENKVRVWIQLNNNKGEQLWGHTFEKNDADQSLWEYENSILKYLIAYLMGIRGVILRDQLKRITNKNDLSNLILPFYWYSEFDANYNECFTTKAKEFYHQLIDEEPENALGHAFLCKILIGELLLFPKDKDRDEIIQQGYTHCKSALKLDPLCQQAYIGMAAVYFLEHEKSRCIDILDQGLRVNPRNFDYQNSMGAILFSLGEFEKGAALLHENYQLNPNNILRWQKMYYAYYLYHQNKYDEAIVLLEQINLEGISTAILKAAAYAQKNCMKEGQDVVNQLKKDFPNVHLSDRVGLKKYFYSESLIEGLLEGLSKLKV
ncbi:hypothetical protein WJR50_16685 [Catalinimonas sp. 4WD22]|uniref:hypothetical protein n=1 Tax=Catalinimonas locisalis TaxID=3133978 RepID=UPI003100DD01